MFTPSPCFWLFPTLYGGFLKWWYPTTMGFPTKKDHFGVFWRYHHLRKHPYLLLKIPTTSPYHAPIHVIPGASERSKLGASNSQPSGKGLKVVPATFPSHQAIHEKNPGCLTFYETSWLVNSGILISWFMK